MHQAEGGARGPCAGQEKRRSGMDGRTLYGGAACHAGAAGASARARIATIGTPPEGASGALRLSKGVAAAAVVALSGLTTTETLAGSKAEPTMRVRGCPSVGAADSSTTASISQPHRKNLPVRRFMPG